MHAGRGMYMTAELRLCRRWGGVTAVSQRLAAESCWTSRWWAHPSDRWGST